MIGYVYYSTKCKFCYDLMKLMENHGLNQLFKFESVDGWDVAQFTQLQIRETPTLAIITMNNGKKQMIVYEGKKAFEWVKQFLINKRDSAIKNAEASRKLIQSENTKSRLNEGLFEFCPNEQNGISDSYALCNENIDIALPKSFLSYDSSNIFKDAAGESIMTVPIGNMNNYKRKEGLQAIYGSDTRKLISQLEDTRKKQDQHIQNIVEQGALSKIVNNVVQS